MRLEREGTCALCADRAYCMHQWSKRRSGFRYHLLTERAWKARRTNLKTIKTGFLPAVCMTLRAGLCVAAGHTHTHTHTHTHSHTLCTDTHCALNSTPSCSMQIHWQTTAKHIVFYRQGVAVFFLNLWWRRLVRFMLRPIYNQGDNSRYPLTKMLGGVHRTRSGHLRVMRKKLPL